MSCTLKERIHLEDLQLALNRIIERFPYFNVTLKKGLFWKYWEENKKKPEIVAETRYPAQYMNVHKYGNFPFRVKAYYNRIAVEFHHSLTDGTGGITFLRALVADYLYLRGVRTNDWGDLYRYNETPNPGEYDDSYKKNYGKHLPNPKLNGPGYKAPFTPVEVGVFPVITATMSVKQILQAARERKVTITELLASVYIEALQETLFNIPEKKRKKYMKPIRIAVPVNLRNQFPSVTMRNFSYMVNPGINPQLGKHSFNEILNNVHHSLRKDTAKRDLKQFISRNVRGEYYPYVRFLPHMIKKLFGRIIYENMGENQNSGKLSNVGRVTMPEAFANEIENFEFVLAPSRTIPNGCAVVSFKDKFIINFSRTFEEPDVEKYFFRRLVKLGINVKLQTN
jgi:NRPS condensation-like uncharacterized protein